MIDNEDVQADFVKNLVTKRAELLFTCDPSGALRWTNEPAELIGEPAPDFYLCFGSGLFDYRFGQTVSEDFRATIYPIVTELKLKKKATLSEEEILTGFKTALENRGLAFEVESGPAYTIPRESLSNQRNGDLISESNRAVLQANFGYTYRNITKLAPCVGKVMEGAAVSICRTVRRSERFLECGVDTIESQRKLGLGAEVVADWAAYVWNENRIPCYSTQWSNRASLALARKMKLVQFGTDLLLRIKN